MEYAETLILIADRPAKLAERAMAVVHNPTGVSA